ncbi:MAG: S-layer homology domain-containing protein [bacterium]|nr:S-layer homology domain-containing protein [bacterium]
MKKTNKLIALICSLAMVFSLFANFTVVNAEDPTAGVELSLDSSSTETVKVINFKYYGMSDGIATYTMVLGMPEGNVESVKTDDTLFGSVTEDYKEAANTYTVSAMSAGNLKSEDGTIGKITVTLKQPLAADFEIKALNGSLLADENANGIFTDDNSMGVNTVLLEAPKPTDAPATPIPTCPPVEKGIELSLDASSTDTVKVVNFAYKGMPDGIATYTMVLGMPEGNVESVKTDDTLFGPVTEDYKEAVNTYTVSAMSAGNLKSETGAIGKVTITLKQPLTNDFVLQLLKGSLLADEDANGIFTDDESMPAAYVVLTAPSATDAPATASPEPTVEPTETPVLGSVKLGDLVSAEKAKEAEAAEKTTYVTLTITKANGDQAVYGVDYVAKDGDKVLTPEEFFNTIWGYNSEVKPSEAIDKYTIAALTPDLNVSAKLNVVGEDEALDNGSEVVAPSATAEPTAKPGVGEDENGAKFSKWSTNNTPTLTKGSTKRVTVTFDGIPKEATNVKITFKSDNTSIVSVNNPTTDFSKSTGVAKSTVTITGKANKKAETYIYAELSYRYNGEVFDTVVSDDFEVETKKSSSSNSSSSGSGSGITSGVIAGNGSTTPSLTWPDGNYPVNFQDLDQAPWAEDAIRILASMGIVNGRSATAFEPMGEITRAEFAKLVVTIYGINVGEGTQSTVYPDVVGGEWYTPYVNAAAQYGIVTGYPDGMFRPDALVSRQEMAVMMYRAITTFRTQLPTIYQPKAWTDTIPAWSADAINALQVAGIMNGVSDTEFGATDASTRAMAAQMIYNLYTVVD